MPGNEDLRSPAATTARKPIVLGPGEGRLYPMGRISAVFKADEDESDSRYSIQNGGSSLIPKGQVLTLTPTTTCSTSLKEQ